MVDVEDDDIIVFDLEPEHTPAPEVESFDDRLKQALAQASIDLLKKHYRRRLSEMNEPGFFALCRELSVRRIAPSFRGLVKGEWLSGNATADFMLAYADLQWLSFTYPDQQVDWSKAQGIFDPATLHRTAKYLLYDGRRKPHQLVAYLQLTARQQIECLWIRLVHASNLERATAHKRTAAARAIAFAIHKHDRRPEADKHETIDVRVELWHLAELADWSPQYTADLYRMKTGVELPRNVVARHLESIQKALPSKREKRRTKKK
jgi:hypothetical protein